MTKKEARKQFGRLRVTNDECVQFIDYLKSNHDFTSEELKLLTVMSNHLVNMNVLFTDLEKGIK